MFRIVLFTLFLFFLSFVPVSAWASVIAICGESKGHSYYPYRNSVADNLAGWTEDGVKGTFLLTQNEAGEFDLLIGDSEDVAALRSQLDVGIENSGMYSSVANGATVFPIAAAENSLTIVVLYSGLFVETYVFQKLTDGQNHVMWTQAKPEIELPYISAFEADCDYFNVAAAK